MIYYTIEENKNGWCIMSYQLLTQLLNESLVLCGLPEMSHTKTRVFVQMNEGLKNLSVEETIHLIEDFGLTLPALVLSDVNTDYACLLQNRIDIDVSGFVKYMDIFILTITTNNIKVMKHFTKMKKRNAKDIRVAWIKKSLEKMINTKYKSSKQIIEDLYNEYLT